MHQPTEMIAHTTSFVTPVVEHWLEQTYLQRINFTCAICQDYFLVLKDYCRFVLTLLETTHARNGQHGL